MYVTNTQITLTKSIYLILSKLYLVGIRGVQKKNSIPRKLDTYFNTWYLYSTT